MLQQSKNELLAGDPPEADVISPNRLGELRQFAKMCAPLFTGDIVEEVNQLEAVLPARSIFVQQSEDVFDHLGGVKILIDQVLFASANFLDVIL